MACLGTTLIKPNDGYCQKASVLKIKFSRAATPFETLMLKMLELQAKLDP